MSFFGNIFPGSNQSGDKSPFERWSSPSPVISVPAGRLDVFPLHSLSVGSHSVSSNLGPSIVIGLGDAGALALHQWLEPLIGEVAKLKQSATDAGAAGQMEKIDAQVKRYAQYFE